LFRWAQADQELDDELRDHLELKTQECRARGMTLEEARRQARLSLGGVEQVKEDCRDARRVNWIQDLIQDIRYGLRTLRKSPGFAAVAVLTLALGIGANTAIFSAVYALLLKPLPFKGSDRLVFILKKNPPRGWTRNPISPAEVLAWRNQSGAFEDIAAYTQRTCVLTGEREPEEDPCEVISSNMFPLLNVVPIRGRPFSADEDKDRAPRVAIL